MDVELLSQLEESKPGQFVMYVACCVGVSKGKVCVHLGCTHTVVIVYDIV